MNNNRIIGVYVMLIMCFCTLFFKLYNIAVNPITEAMPSLSGQYTRKIDIASRRGFIFDRTGQIIAGFNDGYAALADPSKISAPYEDVAQEMEKYSFLSYDDILLKLTAGRPFLLKTDRKTDNDYITSFPLYKRNDGKIPAIHLIGYLDSEGNGVTGIEREYNDFLNASSSSVYAVYESDAARKSFAGIPIDIYNSDSYSQKAGITLTLDLALQKKIEEIADSCLPKGAIVISSVSTGEILASLSKPDFDLSNIQDYLTSENGEFINRAFNSFTPGSVFKTVVSAAALELTHDYFDFEFECTGETDVYGQSFACYNHIPHGKVTMADAFAQSCNCYFINLALTIGYENIYHMAKSFGTGEMYTLDRLNVGQGNIKNLISPPPAYTANTAIGQGELLLTPLEVTRIIGCIANGGTLQGLTLVKAMYNSVNPRSGIRIISEKTAEIIREMMLKCVEEGTGTGAKPQKGGAGGKTSSAESGQYVMISSDGSDETGKKTQIIHSWFSGFYPAQNPLFVITVLSEGGVTYEYRSTVVFKQICDYLKDFIY